MGLKIGVLAGCIASAFVVSEVAAETSCRVERHQYEALAAGMSYAQAVSILGCEGEELSSSDMGGFKTIMLMWSGTSIGGNMNAMFQNNQLINKAQFGLK